MSTQEIRLGVVFYGGVSLAVYENGVARALHDLQRKRDGLGLLADMLEANVVVDTISGASAGGINGLMLAAALESGQDFAACADLWREHGGIDQLLRPAVSPGAGESILDGEGYYQNRLHEAFLDVMRPVPGYSLEHEIDVLVTGTHLDGLKRNWVDGTGAEIQEWEHRCAFHLKHRPGRARLGGLEPLQSIDDRRGDVTLRAAALASIARITSSFPVAFPPFRLSQLRALRAVGSEKDLGAIGSAVLELAGIPPPEDALLDAPGNWMVDGGVLDNKPIRLLLSQLQHRLPSRATRRVVLFVDPDPVAREERANEWSAGEVVAAALVGLPGQQDIGAWLELMGTRDERARWLDAATAAMSRNGANDGLYAAARARSITLAPLAPEGMPDAGTRTPSELLRRAGRLLTEEIATQVVERPSAVDGADPAFHERRLLFVVSQLERQLGVDDDPGIRRLLELLGRFVKAVEIIRADLNLLQIRIVDALSRDPAPEQEQAAQLLADTLLQETMGFLDASRPHWIALTDWGVPAALDREGPLRESPVFGWRALEALHDDARAAASQWSLDAEASGERFGDSILDRLHRGLLELLPREGPGRDLFAAFLEIDRVTFPLRFSMGEVHSLPMELARISPRDRSGGAAGIPLAGHGLAHFAGFLRKDWRSNDISWGRIDGACRLTQALLSDRLMGDEPWARRQRHLLRRGLTNADPERILRAFPKVDDDARHELLAACGAARANLTRDSLARLRAAMSIAFQQQIQAEELATIVGDIADQEMGWGIDTDAQARALSRGPVRSTFGAALAPMLLSVPAAQKRLRGVFHRDEPAALGRTLREALAGLPLPVQRRVARRLQSGIDESLLASIPAGVAAEWITRAWVLGFGIAESSLEKWKWGSWVPLRRARLALLHPVRALNAMFWLSRTDRRFLALASAIVVTLAVAVPLTAIRLAEEPPWKLIAAGIVALLAVGLVHAPTGGSMRRIGTFAKFACIALVLALAWRGVVAEKSRFVAIWSAMSTWSGGNFGGT